MTLEYITILSFLTAALAVTGLFGFEFNSRNRVKQSLKQLSAYENSGKHLQMENLRFEDRVFWPALNRIEKFVKKWSFIKGSSQVEQKLLQAGVRSLNADKFLSVKFVFAGMSLVVYLFFILSWLVRGGRLPWLGIPLVVIAFYIPDIWLNLKKDKRQRKIRSSLADMVDILTIAIEAGSSFDSALTKVVKNSKGPLSEEFGRMLWELQVGVQRREALKNLGERNAVPELQKFCTTMIQADTFGMSISKILRSEVKELRVRQKQAAEEAALKIPVKLVFPVVLCILPALIIVIVGPGLISITQTFLKGL